MPKFRSFSEAKKYIEKAVADTLANEVNASVQQVEKQTIREVVYDAYEPKLYKRRHSLYELEGKVTGGNTLEVRNTAKPSGAGSMAGYDSPSYDGVLKASTGKDLVKTIEYGGYSNGEGDGYDFYDVGPRPFIQTTIERLASGKQHVAAMKRGLKKKGISVQ